MLERDGRLTLPEGQIYDGIRQSASQAVVRYSLLRNLHVFNRKALTKFRGIRRIHTTDIASGADMLGGFDAHFQGGTQKMVVVNTGDAYLYNTATGEFDAQSQGLANAAPKMLVFNDKLLLMNGTNFRSMTSAGTWTAVGGSPPAAQFGTVHAERLLVAGVSGSEHLFYPSGIRDETDWDASLAVIVDSAEASSGLTNLGRLGPYVIVQTRQSTHAYQLSTDNPRDWDNFDISGTVGIVTHRSWIEVEGAKGGDQSKSYAFFWSNNGPYMLSYSGSRPTLVSLMDPIMRSVRGEAYQSAPALEASRYNQVEAAYVPEFGQVRFGVSSLGSSANDLILWVDVESAIDFADGKIEYPYWGIRDNANLGYVPCDALFTARVDSSGHPSAAGQERCFGARNGVVYEYDAPSVYLDQGSQIPIDMRRRGYSGEEEGVASFHKSVRGCRTHATQVAGDLYVEIIADGGTRSGTATIDLSANLTVWGGSTWGGGKWNSGEFVSERADAAVGGTRFELRMFDNGNIQGAFMIDAWELFGYVEDRR